MPNNLNDLVAGQGRYDNYTQKHEYEHDSGVIALPVCGPTSKVRLIRLHGGYGVRRVRWAAARQGLPPVMPAAQDTGADKLISTQATLNLPVIDAQNGQYMFTASGEYMYVQLAPRIVGRDTFPTASYPFGVEPLDTLANELARPVLANGQLNTLTQIGDAIAGGAYATAPEGTRWPFTFVPKLFTAATILS